ncbi:MAG: GTP-binding protein [Mariprofundaceae bacterium]|nr:GTP-binding protein [Mariprofundaceae bacterium]
MQIKIFTAPRLHEALALVRQGLGPEAIILDRMEGRNEEGNKVWHVHAALDAEEPVRQKNDKVNNAEAVAQPMHTHHMEASMHRLERIVEGLGRKEEANLRHAMSDKASQEAFDQLVALGVAPAYAFDLAEDYANHEPIGTSTLHWGERIKPSDKRVVMLLAGPSGAGKTLLAAKLATYYSMRGVRVGLLSSDVDRMGGSDVLKAYADILGVPFATLRGPDDVPTALETTNSAQLLLVDSEGWNIHRLSKMKKQSVVWDALHCTHRILVMPANMDESDGMELLLAAEAFQMSEMAFTKLDETSRPGKIINWAMSSKFRLSYGVFGSEVPGQMGWLSPKALTALLERQRKA